YSVYPFATLSTINSRVTARVPKWEMRMGRMAAFTASGSLGASLPVPAARLAHGTIKRRRVSTQAGRALEILGHAIEYLADEYVHYGRSFSDRDGQVEAVQLLMSINRQIYLECPEVPTIAERCRSFLHPRAA
ncbi:MAG: hypothetical protein WBE56_11230, partial [Terracidiphilus sp.]